MTTQRPPAVTPATTCAAIERLISAARVPSGQGERVARFLLAWWNSDEWGGFPPLDLRAVDTVLSDAMLTVLAHLATHGGYADTYGYGGELSELCIQWWHLKGDSESEEQKMKLVAASLAIQRSNRERAKATSGAPRPRIDMTCMPPPVPRPMAK